MVMTFHNDSQFRNGIKNEGKSLKRPVTLNLESPNAASKKQRFATILTSPDLNRLKLATPEIEKFIIANGSGIATPTPTQILDALNQLHQTCEMKNGLVLDNSSNATKLYTGLLPIYLTSPTQTSVIKSPQNNISVLTTLSPTTIRPPSVDSNNSNSLPLPLEFTVKEEFHTTQSDFSTPPLSPISNTTPIDMADQERIKLERKRHRNRIAASKCRKKKLEKISELEEKVNELKDENAKLVAFAENLREQVFSLRQTVLDHVKKGCQIMVHQSL